MKRRSFIQGLAAVYAATFNPPVMSKPSVLPSQVPGGKQVDYVDSVVYDISPVDNPYLSYSDPDQLHEQRARLRKLRYINQKVED